MTAGALDRSLYLILDGLLEVLVDRGRRGHRRIAAIGPGSVIGELSFFDGGARSALVRAVTPAELAELSPTEFDVLAIASPAWPVGCCSTSAGFWLSGYAPLRRPRPWEHADGRATDY